MLLDGLRVATGIGLDACKVVLDARFETARIRSRQIHGSIRGSSPWLPGSLPPRTRRGNVGVDIPIRSVYSEESGTLQQLQMSYGAELFRRRPCLAAYNLLPAVTERKKRKKMYQNWRTSAAGGATLVLLGAKVIGPKFGIEIDVLMFSIGVLAIGQIVGADAAAVLRVRRILDDTEER